MACADRRERVNQREHERRDTEQDRNGQQKSSNQVAKHARVSDQSPVTSFQFYSSVEDSEAALYRRLAPAARCWLLAGN